MKFLKIVCLLFLMFFSFSLAFAEETVINVSGPDILTDGACYSATGGTAPYLWKTSEGSIDNSGCVSNISAQCGTAAIIASDDCRVTGSKAVTLHGGVGAISISGADAPQNDFCYVANNAVGTVQWGITKGSINSNGCVSNISGRCGAATVTATDSCGETAVKNVRMPSGQWLMTSYYLCSGAPTCGGSMPSTIYDGIYKYNFSNIHSVYNYGNCSYLSGTITSEPWCEAQGYPVVTTLKETFTWVCP